MGISIKRIGTLADLISSPSPNEHPDYLNDGQCEVCKRHLYDEEPGPDLIEECECGKSVCTPCLKIHQSEHDFYGDVPSDQFPEFSSEDKYERD